MTDPIIARLARIHGCRACAYFRSPVADLRTGTCHVNPPRTSTARWPAVDGREWCGSWTPVNDEVLGGGAS